MACKERDDKCFVFLWKLENIILCSQKKGEFIESPAFVVDAIQKTKWKLNLYPRGCRDANWIGLFLKRETDSKGANEIEIECELALITENGSALVPRFIKYAFPKGGDYGYNQFQNRENVFTSEREVYLPRDNLCVRCRIWKSVGKMKELYQCSAHTRIGMEKRSFLWNVKNFSALEPEKKITYLIKSIEDEASLMSVDLSLTGGLSSEEIIRFELSLQDQTIKFCTLRLNLIDASGCRIECNHDEFWFDSLSERKQFTFHFTKKKILAKESVYLPDDVLSLHWEWVFSKGVVLKEIEEVQYGYITYDKEIPEDRNVNYEKMVPLSYILNDNLKSLYDENFLCDVKLKTNTSIFNAHKVILSASSSVFKAMFSSDMKEKNGDCVNIEDLSDDTVRRMLLYIYTARIEDETWENTSQLYVAADKYALLSLKNVCSSYLKSNLSPSNACEVLLLADFHADGKLKRAIQDYILKHNKDIINSDEWELLMDTNGRLAAETLCLRYK